MTHAKKGTHCVNVGSTMQKDLVDPPKHYIHEIDALEKKKKINKKHAKTVKFRGIQLYKINFVSRDLCTRCGPVCLNYLF